MSLNSRCVLISDMDLVSRIDALPSSLQEIIGRHLTDDEYVQWRVYYRVKLPNEPEEVFYLPQYQDEDPLELAIEVAARTCRFFKSRKRCMKFAQILKEKGRLYKTHSMLQVDLFKILTQNPKVLQRTLRIITLFVRFNLVDMVRFQVWKKTWGPPLTQYECVPLDVFARLVGPSIAKNPYDVQIIFNKYSLTPAQKAEIIPWGISTQGIDPSVYEMEEEEQT